ncbi:hypothetical protein N7462_001123 [Penicillium macrosclerotiorum]|uniref:uncharacterized protein n=1 Tax=Penicillium macrosclerotiorum TaxID=303699 RepID=UPI002546C3C1|nr:uncharacterized protein N7462_001123 [Penicillium macrosclerotiorum]KAJ5699118.1 hypothetical protein N7462_001123 [Penicillium macrosclerotiorum]
MRTLKDFFHRPSFSKVHLISGSETEGQEHVPTNDSGNASSPLSEPLTFFDHNGSEPDTRDPTDTQGERCLSPLGDGGKSGICMSEQIVSHAESAAPSSSVGSLHASQRILKDGKEVVISSDGEDTDSVSSLDDPSMLFAPNPRGKNNSKAQPAKPDQALLARLSAPKKYKNTLDSLVNAAVDDNETEANVAKFRATFAQSHHGGNQSVAGPDARNQNALNERMLTSALGEHDEGPGLKRLIEAVRRTEALDQDRAWRFLDLKQMTTAAPIFPKHLFPPGSRLAALRGEILRFKYFQISKLTTGQNLIAAHACFSLHGICTTAFETIKTAQFQSRMLQFLLPTSPWTSLARYRLAAAFLLQDPTPLSEPPEQVLDLSRVTFCLMRDKRFLIKQHKGANEYDYGELIALTMLLDIIINSALRDLQHDSPDAEKEFNNTVDRLATQLKNIFTTIESTGASHLKRMVAKDALEALHHRVVFSVRSKPPPKKSFFETFADRRNSTISSHFKVRAVIDTTHDDTTTITADGEGTLIPIRGHAPFS